MYICCLILKMRFCFTVQYSTCQIIEFIISKKSGCSKKNILILLFLENIRNPFSGKKKNSIEKFYIEIYMKVFQMFFVCVCVII